MAGKEPSRQSSLLRLKVLKFLNAGFRRCRTVSSSAHWKLVSYPFLWTTPAMLPVFLRPFTNALMWRAKEMINDGSQINFIIELL